ncbi:MAG TPA: hypothetical protein VM871_04970 [Flavisolibacter sp.]|nr:hypothetical protein [Flavisolibacter sp.]
MKIITWNCIMACRIKAHAILAYVPDVLFVPECEHPDKLKFSAGTAVSADILCSGNNQHKDLGVFSYGNYKLRLLENHTGKIKTMLPVVVTGGPVNFILFAIWAYNPQDPHYT